ncbi:MAG: gliding motility-associated C-terminal domain-containing protein [Paludibacteraceae bacterium]|nr:gliding motility-associated C-terminal domain-containing protein [Paludibacteraceae bacterium]
MKNLISYKKSGPNALRKAFSLIVVLCTFLQTAKSQDFIVESWYQVSESESRVTPYDACGAVYHVYVKPTAENAKFAIKYSNVKGGIKEVNSLISTSLLEVEDDFHGGGLCQFTLPGSSELRDFYLDISKDPVVVSQTVPDNYEMIMISTDSKLKSVNIGSKIKFTSLPCISDASAEPTYTWKISKDGETWINPSSTNTEKDFEYTALSDIKYIKCEGTYVDASDVTHTVKSNVITLSLNEPTFNVEIVGEGVRNINKTEKEVPSWRDVVIKMVDLPSSNVSNPKISYKPLGGKNSYKTLEEAILNEDKQSWNFYADRSGWMKVEVDVEVPASDGTFTTVTLKKEFIFRLVYSPDKEDAVQELFFDDFGYFKGNEYHYVKYVDGTVTDQDAIETVDASLPSSVKWMDDQNGFIKEHDFALTDPRIKRLPEDEYGPVRNTENCWSKPASSMPFQCWCENGYRVEDGYYAFVPNPAMADGGSKTDGSANDYWNGSDHTGSADGSSLGAMLMVNCADVLDKVIYERDFEITGECANVMVLFSAFVSNAQSLSNGGAPVNIRMDIYEQGGTEVLTSIESGDVITRDYGANSWSNLTALFPLSKGDNTEGSKKYTLKITNNAASGSGNDILLDDISLKVCFPEIEVKAEVTSNEILDAHNVVICGKSRDLTLSAFNRAGIKNYIPTPYYLFQYFDEATEKWVNLPKTSESTESAITEEEDMDITLNKSEFNGDTKFRVVVGNSKETIVKVVTDGIAKPSCEYTYAISEDFHVKFNPVGENLDLFGCIGDTIKVDADANGRPSIEWFDYSGNTLTVNDSIVSINKDKVVFVIPESILKSNNKSDTIYMLATSEGNLCSDTQIVSITKYDDLDFDILNDTFYCEFDKNLSAVDVYPTSGIEYVWTLKGSNLGEQTGSEFNVLKSTPELYDNTVIVTGSATGYCPTTKSADFSIYRRYSLNLTVDVEGADKKVANVCLPTDGESSSRVDLKVEKVYAEGSTPSYANEKVTTYFWYRKDGSNDSTLIGQGTEKTFVDRLTENNIYTYSVTALDEVCYKNDGVATSDTTVINARKPLIVKLTEDKEEICKDDTITLNVKLTNTLKADTITSRFYENGAALTSLLGSDKDYSYVPVNATKEKVTKNIKVEVMDMICSPSKPVSDSVKFDVFVPLVVSLSTDADNDKKCIRKETGDDYINVTLTVEQGNPRSVEWFDGQYPGLVFNRPVTVAQGENKISVKAYDEVCRATGAAEFVEGADTSRVITAQEPIVISLDANTDSICNGTSVDLKMKVTNSLVTGPEVRWYERYNGVEDLTYTDRSSSSTKSHTPKNLTDFVIKKSMIVKTVDEICNAGKDVMDSVSYNIFIPIKLTLAHDADINGDVLQRCIREDNVDNVVNLEVKVAAGNPSKLTWSDGKYNDDLVFKREFRVSPGSNPISVVGSDGVCPASANDNDDLSIVAATPIVLTLKAKNPDVCDGSDVEFELTVDNTLDKDNVEVRWFENDAKVYTTNGASLTKPHTSTNETNAKLGKTMVVKTDDEICSKGVDVVTSADYVVYKPIKFYLTSDASEFDVPNTKCLGQTSHGGQNSAEIKVNLTQGNPSKFVWSDEIIWEWYWDNRENNTVRNFDLKPGKNTLSVTAYDNVCNKEGESEYKGEGQDINIEARTPIKVTLDLASGRHIMCKGEDISLIATVNNENEGINSYLEWNENHGVENKVVENGSFTTSVFTPDQGDLMYSVKASENVDSPICPAQTAYEYVSVQVNTTLKIFAAEDAICQDTSGRDTVKLVKLTCHVLTGKPQGIIWSTGDTTKIDTGYSFLNVAPMENIIYSAYGYDSVCVKTTPAYTEEIDVDHRVYVTLAPEEDKVQMGNEVKLNTEYSIPADGVRYYEMVSPEAVELERNTESEFSWQLDEPGRYQFIVKLENGNCGVRESNIITVDVADYVVVPNVITPYNDNVKNDKFMSGYDVKIFNRYQETVYEGTDGWDATYRGELASPGTYFYVLTKKDGRVLKGTVEVYRK